MKIVQYDVLGEIANSRHIPLICGYAAIILTFFVSVYLRLPYIGTLSDGHHQWLTAHARLIIENWMADGVLNDHFLGPWIPASIEVPNFTDREIYVSYPLGFAFVIYLLTIIFHSTSTILLMQIYGLFNQLCIALLIFSIVTTFHFVLDRYVIYTFGTLAAIAYLCLPAPYYWHAMVYYADQAAILPFIFATYLEALIRKNPKNHYFILQSLVLLFTASVDYIAVPLGVVLFLFRLITPLSTNWRLDTKYVIANVLQILLPIALVYVSFITWIYYLGFGETLIGKLLLRTGIDLQGDTDYHNPIYQIFISHLHIYYPFYIACMVFLFYNFYKEKSECFLIPLIGFLTATLQVLLLPEHSAVHDFAALKFFPPLAMTLFGIMPLVMLEKTLRNKEGILHSSKSLNSNVIQWTKTSLQKLGPGTLFILFSGMLICMVLAHAYLRPEFPPPGIEGEALARYIRNHSDYRNVYISFDGFEIDRYTPQKLSISRKLVHSIKSIADLEQFLAKLSSYAHLYAVISPSNQCVEEIETPESKKVGGSLVMRVDSPMYLRLKSCVLPSVIGPRNH